MLVREIRRGRNSRFVTIYDPSRLEYDTLECYRVLGLSRNQLWVGYFGRESRAWGHLGAYAGHDLITAWRVYELLPRLDTIITDLRNETTLDQLVRLITDSKLPEDLDKCSSAFGYDMVEMLHVLDRANALRPDPDQFGRALRQLPWPIQKMTATTTSSAIRNDRFPTSPLLNRVLEEIREFEQDLKLRVMHEDQLIAAGLNSMGSLSRLLEDLGVTHLYNVLRDGVKDVGPTHFGSNEVDGIALRHLIGSRRAYHRFVLKVSERGPSEHVIGYSHDKEGRLHLTEDSFGYLAHPRVLLGRRPYLIRAARFEHATMRIVLEVVDASRQHAISNLMSIEEIRAYIGKDYNLGGPLRPGTPAPWLSQA